MSTAVIGNGFWGSAIARRLREMGHEVVVYADPATPGASAVAAGLVKLGWYRTDTVRKIVADAYDPEQIEVGLDWLSRHVPITPTPETFVNQMRGTSRTIEDTRLADPREVMVRPDVAEAVLSIQPRLHSVTVETRSGVTAHGRVVVAAGAKTDEVLGGLGFTGVSGLYGRAIMFDAPEPEATGTGLLTVMTRPYNHVTFRRLRGRWRGGDTVERKGVDPKRIAGIVETGSRYFSALRNVEIVGGDRPVCEAGIQVREVARHVIAATGGHRVGLGLSGAVALHVGRMLS